MAIAVNLTPHTAAELVTRDGAGAPLFVVAVKACYGLAPDNGRSALVPRPLPPQPFVPHDRYAGPPATSSLLVAGEIGPPKPRVDVLLAGALRFPGPTTDSIVALQVGRLLDKRLRVVGDRAWVPRSSADPIPSRAQPIYQVPIAWERAAGGTHPRDPQLSDRRNPAGCTTGRSAADFVGRPLPSFEHPDEPVTSWRSPPAPHGFGAIAPHWEPRARLAGRYDEDWRRTRAPLLPEDFDPGFLNCAPADQQLSHYPAGHELLLLGMSPQGRLAITLPELNVPVTFVMRDLIEEVPARVDTVAIDLDAWQLTLIARAVAAPRPTAVAMRQIFVGPLTRGRRRALELGKDFLDLRALPRARGAAA